MDAVKNYSDKPANPREIKHICIVTAVISFILSGSQVLLDPVINSDGILYISTAYHLQNDDWQTASQQYNWLFFPLIIAQLSGLTGLSLEYSAYILNAFFTAITCTSFVLIIKEFGGKDKTTLWFASLIILCFPNLNEYRNLIIRDHGYWAFYLLSCYFFIKACQQTSIKSILLLLTSSSMATLFRVEGLLFTLLLPVFTVIVHSSSLNNKTKLTVQALAALLVITLVYIASGDQQVKGFTKTSQLEHALEKPFEKIEQSIEITKSYIEDLSPQGFSNKYAPTILACTFILILITEVTSAISPFYALMLLMGFLKQNDFQKHPFFIPWIYLILINVIILCGFLASRFFLAGRYPIPLALTLLTPLPFIAKCLYQKYKDKGFTSKQNKIIKLALSFFILLSIDGVVSTGASKTYLKEAGLWISSLQTDQELSLYSNNTFVSYYATGQNKNRVKEDSNKTVLNKISRGKLKEFDLLAIQISRKNTDEKATFIESLKTQPLKTFNNKKGDSVLIFRP